MKTKRLAAVGIPKGAPMKAAYRAARDAAEDGLSKNATLRRMREIVKDPDEHVDDPVFGELAEAMVEYHKSRPTWVARESPAPWRKWGDEIGPKSIRQIENACRLPISVRGALMPDAHMGYGLPIGGVLGTRNAVIPYAVGVDIACRMKMSILDRPVEDIDSETDELIDAIERETRFGVGARFNKEKKRTHEVLDRDWSVSPVTERVKDKAWAQLGSSGSGNHFVEFGEVTIESYGLGIPKGTYLALLSHSGSRGPGAMVADHYSKLARSLHPELPKELRHLAWLGLDTAEGEEYWAAMQLMGEYAAANHACIHRTVTERLGSEVVLDIENHHNFAWKEEHDGETLIVHRKGATPAPRGAIGIIPGSMADETYVVRGLGNPTALDSAAHGAGRRMSRTKAKKTFSWPEAKRLLKKRGVRLISAGLDEVPMVYKNIRDVMAAQSDLVEPLASFRPRIVKMAPGR